MVDEAVGSLGSAIAGGTNLSGAWDMPITKGLQLNQQDEFKRMQAEAQAIERDRKEQEAIRKFITYEDTGKWNFANNAKAFGDYYQSVLPKLKQAYKDRDEMAMAKMRNEIAMTAAQLRTIDRDQAEIFRPVTGSLTRRKVQDIYSKQGFDGLIRENEKYPFAPLTYIEGDNIKVKDVADPKLDKVINQKITDVFSGMPTLKKIGFQGSQPVFEINKNDPNYIEARNAALIDISQNKDLVDAILYTQDFRDFYDKNVTSMGKSFEEIDEEDLTDILKSYIIDKFDGIEKTRTKTKVGAKPSSGSSNQMGVYFTGGKDVFTFSDMGDGIKKVGTKGTGAANPEFTGTITTTNISTGQPSSKKVTYKMLSPEIKYIGNGKFQVQGRREGDDVTSSLKELIVDAAAIKSALSLNDKGLEQFFGYKASAPASAKKAPAKPAAPANKWEKNKRKTS